MFTIKQIEEAHSKVKSGADFPIYIQEIKKLGVTAFTTYVTDSHTVYFGTDEFKIQSAPKYKNLQISDRSDRELFTHCLKIHQQGETDYYTFCKHCAETGIENWEVSLQAMTCTYFDKAGNKMLTETIPTL